LSLDLLFGEAGEFLAGNPSICRFVIVFVYMNIKCLSFTFRLGKYFGQGRNQDFAKEVKNGTF